MRGEPLPEIAFRIQNADEVQELREMSAGQREVVSTRAGGAPPLASEAARKRAAVELIRRHERTLRRTARRYSLCGDDAEDAYQRALEILLLKAPTADQRELIRWMQTVTKHEAMAVRRNRERMLGGPPARAASDGEEQDWIQLIPSPRDGPADQAERRERVARTREALQTLKPHELRALTLLAEGYSYAEIGEITGWSYTKINRCLAEGRQRFRAVLTSSEEGRRCDDLGQALSAFCDGEADEAQESLLREHLRACAHCRSKLRAFRAAPQAAAALAPILPASRSLVERAHEAFAAASARIPGRGGSAEAAATQLAAGGDSRGAGFAAVAKVLAACVGTAGGAAACVATGVVPNQLDPLAESQRPAAVKRVADEALAPQRPAAPVGAPTPIPAPPVAAPARGSSTRQATEPKRAAVRKAAAPQQSTSASSEPAVQEFGAESAPAPAPSPAPTPTPAATTSGGSSSGGGGSSGASAAQAEFGP